ncbi:MAG: KEOPS complex kinase/ATPase Bud32 [Candidatus Aenigmarchaeota archaeon]|nr:KEOPS complex kinase/ATPase Bud32 [Candidatus Aenigmarchaeota archaeon]
MKIIQRGAEAVLYLEERDGDKVLVKDRLPKGYRIPQLDEKIRTQRTKREESLILKARRAGVNAPNIVEARESKIIMEWIEGKKIKDTLNSMPRSQRMEIYKLIGESIGKLHSNGIIHGDLTTSNMIFKDGRLYIIDFGLGKISGKIEDQAVDLYLLYEALKSTHLKRLNEAWEGILKAYKQNYSKSKEVLNRVLKIEKRRRYKGE